MGRVHDSLCAFLPDSPSLLMIFMYVFTPHTVATFMSREFVETANFSPNLFSFSFLGAQTLILLPQYPECCGYGPES